MFPDTEIEAVKQVWERNLDQIRLMYNYYAAAVESRRFGSGPLKLLMNVDNCKEMLQDFQLLPQLVDVQVKDYICSDFSSFCDVLLIN